MTDFREIAKMYIANGFRVIPVTSEKRPAIGKWLDLQVRTMTPEEVEKSFKNCYGIALLMGGEPSLFAVDFDLKYSLVSDLYDRIKKEVPLSILEKAYVQKTINKGYHWIFKVPQSRLTGNDKFANRYTTYYEKHEVYMDHFRDPLTAANAAKTAANHKSMVLVESRSGSPERCGGYVLMPPTQGYSYVSGKIQELTEEEYDKLVEILRGFNEVKEMQFIDRSYDDTEWEKSVWDDFNERGDITVLLQESGWKIISQNQKVVRFKRPGATSGSSALFDKVSRIFSCFSTSTCFDVNKSYNPSGVYTMLETDGDHQRTYKELISLGYGIKK